MIARSRSARGLHRGGQPRSRPAAEDAIHRCCDRDLGVRRQPVERVRLRPASRCAPHPWQGKRRTVITGEVEAELRAGLAKEPQPNDVLQAARLERGHLEATGAHRMFGTSPSETVALPSGTFGEATVLTWAATHTTVPSRSSTMQSPRKVAREHSVTCIGTRSAFSSRLSAPGRSASKWPPCMADIYIETNGRLPFQPGGFVTWAIQAGEIDPPHRS